MPPEPPAISKRWHGLLGAVLLLAAGAGAWHWHTTRSQASTAPTGLFTTLPILWNETGSIAEQLSGTDEPHWARAVLAGGGQIVPLDVLAAPGDIGPLTGMTRLVIAQPRPLSGEENVALDQWVRGGGQVLLFADPALTEASSFAIGDRRRPQSTVLLSPILRRWGLDLLFDETQPLDGQSVSLGQTVLPIALAGRFAALPGAACRLSAAQVVAVCTVGRGRVTAVADAALLERDDPAGLGQSALQTLLSQALRPLDPQAREITGAIPSRAQHLLINL